MSTQVDEDLFTDDFGKWIEKHGGKLFVTAESVSIIGMDLNDLKSAILARESHKGTEDEYTKELEKIVIFMCDVYSKVQDSIAVQTDKSGMTDEKWMDVYMSIPTIQGTMNRIYTSRIGNLRTQLLNREAPSMSLKEVFEKLKVGRREKGASDE